MKFGVLFANTGAAGGPDGAIALATTAEQFGYESLWTVEHPVVPSGYKSTYPYSTDGKMPTPEDVPLPDPLIWLTWAGAATTRIRLATGILILPLRNPAVLAKELATLDHLSGGRVTLGIGTGWLREEFDALGVPWAGRGARTDDYIEAMRALWAPGPSSHHGEFADFEQVMSYPKPAQADGIPIVVGGHSEAAARRAGRLGNDFFPGVEPTRLPELLKTMRLAASEAGRDPRSIGVTIGGVVDPGGVREFAELGVTRLVIPTALESIEACKRHLGAFSESVIDRVR